MEGIFTIKFISLSRYVRVSLSLFLIVEKLLFHESLSLSRLFRPDERPWKDGGRLGRNERDILMGGPHGRRAGISSKGGRIYLASVDHFPGKKKKKSDLSPVREDSWSKVGK